MLHNLSVPKKLILSFMAVIAACGVATLIVLWSVTTLHVADVKDAESAAIYKFTDQARAAAVSQQNALRGYVATQDDELIKAYEEAGQSFTSLRADLAAADVYAAYGQEQAALAEASRVFQAEGDALIALARDPATHPQALEQLADKARLADIRTAIGTIQRKQAAVAKAVSDDKDAAYLRSYISFAIGGVVALVVALASIAWLISALSRPVEAMTRVMGRLAAGDLDVIIPAAGRRDEIGRMAAAVQTFKENAEQARALEAEAVALRQAAEDERRRVAAVAAENAEQDRIAITAVAAGLSALAVGDLSHRITVDFAPKAQRLKDDFNAAIIKLHEAVEVITHRSMAIGSSAHEISQASDDLSRRTEQQAASLEETAAALEQITATVKRSSEGAVEAGRVVEGAHREAVQGQGVVGRAIIAMGQIEESSNQIGNIIGVIDEIAFQTNLLALNAGVEAARAGDAGRGFAVVASEVRALAQRSAAAAKEIKTLISASGRQVGEGVALVGDTGEALKKIADQIGRLTIIAREITSSSHEQATGLQEVNVAVNQMDQVTQQNAAMVEQSTAASHSLAQDARELDRLMSQFRLQMDEMDRRRAA